LLKGGEYPGKICDIDFETHDIAFGIIRGFT
jgi:hypothetical protein